MAFMDAYRAKKKQEREEYGGKKEKSWYDGYLDNVTDKSPIQARVKKTMRDLSSAQEFYDDYIGGISNERFWDPEKNQYYFDRINKYSSDISSLKDGLLREGYDKESDIFKSLDGYKNTLDNWRTALYTERNTFKDYKDADEYKKAMAGWLNDDADIDEEHVTKRTEIYEGNKQRISEIDSLLPYATGDDKKKLKAEREGLIAENNQYERGQKSVDSYYDIKNQDGFGESKKDYNNPTEKDYRTADIRNDSTSWYTTGNGAETKNSLGEIVIKSDGTPGDNYTVENGEIKAKASPVTVDRLGLYNDAKNSGYTNVPVGMEGSYDKIVKDGNDASWDKLTPDEENIYYWLLENNGQKDADNYLDSMTATLNRRAMKEMAAYIDDAGTLERIALNIASVPANVFGGITGFIEDTANTISGKEINPYSPAHSFTNFSSEVRSNTAQKIDEALDGAAIPIIDFSVGDAYQALMSTADSALGATLGGTGYGVLMGMSSATSEARRLYEAGATNGQILWGGLLSGAAEMVFEKVSLDHFLKEGVPENIKGLIKNILAQGGVEASEEVFTEIANTISNTLVMRSQSDWSKTVQSYIDEGYSKSEANKYAFLGTLKNVVNAGLGGFISGGLHSGISSTIAYNTQTVPMRNAYANHIIENNGLPTLMDIAKSMVEAKDEALSKGDLKSLDKLANKADTKGGNKNIGALAMRVNNLSQTVRTADIKQQLTELGVDSKKAGKYAEVINKALNRELTDDDIDLYQEAVGSKEGSQVFEEMLQSMDNPVTSYFADAIGQQTPFSGKYDNYQTAKKFADEKAELEAKATDIPNSTPITETPEITASDVNSDIETDDDRSEAALDNAIKEIDVDIDDSSLQIIKSEYDGSMPVAQFAKGMADGYKFGYSGVPQSAISDSEFYSTLSDKQKAHSYRLGAAAAKAKSEQADAEIKKGFNGKTGRRKGTVKGEGVKLADLKKTFNDTQNKAYKVLSTVSEATGVDIVLYKSTVNEAGEFVDNQGKFKYKDNTIYIDINAGLLNEMDVNELGKYTMLRTFTHEFVHFVEKWNPVEYNSFRKLVFEELTNRGEKVNDLIEDKMSLTEGMSYDKASREVVAEAMTDMLPDSNFIQKIAESNPNVFKKLLEKLKEFLNDIKEYFNSIGHNRSIEANALKEERDGQIHYLESIIKAFDKVAEGAVNNYQRTFGTDEVVTENATTETATNTEAKEQTKETSEPNTTTSEYGYTVTDNPEQRIIEVKFDEKPSREIRDVLKHNRFWFNRERSVWQRNGGWYNTNAKDTVTEALDNAYKAEGNTAESTQQKTPVLRKANEIGLPVVESIPSSSVGGIIWNADDIITKTDSSYTYKTIDAAIVGNDLYFRFRGTYKTNPKKQIFFVIRHFNDYTANEIFTDIINRSKDSNPYPLGRHFEDVVRTIYKEKGLSQGSHNKTIRDLTPTENNTNSEVKENVKETDNSRTVSQADTNGEGTPRLLDESQTSDVSGTGEERKSVEPTSERGTEAGRDGDRTDASDRDSRSEGNGEGGDLRGNDVVTEEVKEAKAEELKETVKEQVEQKSTETPKGKNFTIGDSLNLPEGEKTRFRANIDAIKLVKQLESEGRYATAAEQEILSKYVGWGGLSNAFGEMKYNYDTRKSEMTAKKGWESEFAEFRKLVEDGIITEDEYKAASASTKNAHYTSIEVIKAMYDGLSQLGFKGGRMLEPSSGVGNFVGAMPSSMSSKVNSWTMVELDSITGLIAKYLYPNADVRIQGFEKANIPDNYMDVAIGNVPFGNYGVVDRAYPKRVTKAIHNYFFAKSLDKVRPGGIVMYITSSFTMNSQGNEIRQYIMDRADLLGAIRLPNNAFSGNAGTQVVTDILILKKRKAGTEYAGEAFLEAPYQKIDENSWQGANINEYFTNHPEMVLGTPVLARGMYGAESLTYNPLEGKGTLGEQIREAFKNITVKMDYDTKPSAEKANFNAQRADRKTKESGLVANEDGTISQRQDGKLVKYNTDAATAKRISGILSIRDAYKTLVAYLQQGQAENLIKKARKDLNTAYDKFVKEYGYLNSTKNKSAIEADPDRYSIFALENYDAKSKTATKADIFTKDTIKPNRTITHVDDIESGVIVSINTTGGVDAALIAKLTDKTEDEVTRELIDGRYAFKTKDGSLEAPETYLAGNVRAKLREAEALAPIDPDFNNNVEELKKVIPKDIPFNDIYVTPGSPWIPTEVYADFIAEMLGGYNNPNSYSGPDVTVGRSNQTGEFKIVINNKRLKSRYQNTQQWGTKRRSFIDLITAMMSSTSITVNDYIEDASGKKKAVINKVETAAAQAKTEEIAKEFQDWIWRDENRRNELASLYNETYNALVTPKYSGKNLTINGLNADFTLREHQANAVQRIIASGGNTLLAHKVGAGKTLEMAAAAMKLRELGIVKKPIFAVPKSLVAQWGVEFKSYFPAAKLLVADEKSFSKANRKVFSNTIANGDFDAVIVSYEQFEKIPMSVEYQKKFYQQQIDEIIAAIAEEKAETKGKGITVKEMEKKRAQLEKKIAELTTKAKDEDNIDFEQLGIDSLFVDEAHNFKNLQYVTRMNNISGLGNTNGSQRAFDLYTKIRYLQGLNGGRGIVFATATPVMNSMAEMYIMQKYLQSDMLNQLGLSTFDAWAKQFGEVVNAVEIKPSGQGFRVKQTFSNFRNLNELQLLFRSFSDVLTTVPGLKIPKMKGGKVQTVVCEPGQFQKDYMAELEKRADNIKNVDASVDNMLKITSDGRKVSYTQRMIDPSLPYEPGCKIYRCCDNVLEEYKNSKSIKGTQIIFCDMATPKGKSKTANASTEVTDDTEFNVESARLYDDMRSYLVKKGIPAKEIAFIHEADTDAKKKQLFADVNDGKVRVLIGSTGKMGVGMNAQKRIVAIHHLDAPWRPGDVEQRDGRAFRQKNMNEEVTKYTYVTEGSFDARLWDILDRKQHFINQIMNGEDVGRTAEDTGDVTLSAAEVKALASGNPLIMEQVQLSTDLQKLEDLQRAYKSSIATAKAKMLDDKQKIAYTTKSIENCKKDIKARENTYTENKFSMTVEGKNFSDMKEAGVALIAAITSKANTESFTTIGKFAGFELKVIKQGPEYTGIISGEQGYKFDVYIGNTTHMVKKMCAVVEGLEYKLKGWETSLSELKADLAAQEKMIDEPFSKQEELEQKRQRFNEIMAVLNPSEEQQIADDENDQAQSRAYLRTADEEYLELAKDPEKNKEKLQEMVDKAASKYLNSLLLPNDNDEVGFKYHRGAAPTKTFKRYAVFNVSEDGFRAAYAGNKNATPVGVWLDAQNLQSYMSDMVQFDDGTFASYIPGDTGAATNTKFSPEKIAEYGLKGGQRWLLERGGKHSSDVPNFSQMNLKQDENGNKVKSSKDGALPHNKLIFEIEYGISDDGDLTEYVKEHGRKSKGKNQGLAKIAPNQYYDFKTNPNAVGNWGIGGTFRIVRSVPYDEVVFATEKYKQDSISEANKLFKEGKINKSDRDTRIKNANAIQVQKWVGGYNPAEFGITDTSMYDMVSKGRKMKLTDPVTYDDNGNVIPLSERFNPNIEDIRYQSRTGTLTDREILEYAYDELDTKDFTEGEKASLEVFGKRLGNLRDLQEKRAELGRLYKEQQFGAKVDRAAAAETLNRMRILDSQISKASSELLSVEEKEVLKRVLKKSRGIIEKNERAQAKERLDRWRERRRDSDAIKKYRAKIKADVDELSKWVLKPDNKNALKHIPDALKNTVIPFLTSIDFTSKRQLKGGEATKADKAFVEQLTALKAAMKKNIDINGMYSGYNDLPPNFMDSLQNFIDATKALVEKNSGEFVINKMTGAELKELSKIVRNLKKFITQMNLFHSNAMFKHVYEAGDNSLYYLKGIGDAGGKTGNVSNYLLWQNMRPAYAFERFGEGGQAIYDEFRRAQATLAFNSKAIIDFTDKTYTEAEIKAWEKEEKVFELGGDEVHIPVSFIMSFYELSKQPDSLRHILGEGIRVATYKNGKVKISDNGHTLTGEDVRTIISSLSERQIEVADALQKYMATQGAEWGNYVSLARFGEELFTNPQYFPINSDGRHLDSTVEEHPSNASLYALLNMSFTKQRNEEANNRIILYSIFDVFANHMASMAQYNAFALPVLDAIKWFNYKETTVDNETGKKVTLGSVREEMSRVYGVPEESRPGSGREGYAETFVKNIIRAYNGTETQGISTDTYGLKALRQYNMSQIAYNFRVVVQQPLAITRAGLLIDYSSILKGLKASPSEIKANIDEMYKHSGIAAWKSLGFYDINISRGLTDMIKHSSTAIDKVNEIGMWGAEKADEITWSAIWSACKVEVSKKQNVPYGSPEFFEAVTKLFEDVIYKTQVVDSVLTKTEFMRSKGFFSRAISSFMSEPVTTASMAISAYDKYQTDIQRGMSRQQAWQRNGKLIGRTCAVYSISAILLAAVQAVVDAWRDDDEDESYLEKYLNAFTGNVIDELMPFNKLPVASDFYDLAKELASIFGVDTYGNPPQSVFMQWYDSLVKGTEILYKKISGQNTGYTWYAGIAKMLKALSGITGLPISTATREIVDAWNNTVGALNEKLKVEKYVSNKNK